MRFTHTATETKSIAAVANQCFPSSELFVASFSVSLSVCLSVSKLSACFIFPLFFMWASFKLVHLHLVNSLDLLHCTAHHSEKRGPAVEKRRRQRRDGKKNFWSYLKCACQPAFHLIIYDPLFSIVCLSTTLVLSLLLLLASDWKQLCSSFYFSSKKRFCYCFLFFAFCFAIRFFLLLIAGQSSPGRCFSSTTLPPSNNCRLPFEQIGGGWLYVFWLVFFP